MESVSGKLDSFCMYCSLAPKETKEAWDKLFSEGHGADVYVFTENRFLYQAIPVFCHANFLKLEQLLVQSVASPLLGNILQRAKLRKGMRYIKILGVPCEAAYTFIRFLYSSCYDEEELKFVLSLLALSHSYLVPQLKRVLVNVLEHGLLTKENVIDVLLLARSCDVSRLSFICVRMVVKDFKSIYLQQKVGK